MSSVAKESSAPAAPQLVRIFHVNPSAGPLQHGEYNLAKGGNALVPKDVADLWMTHSAYGNPVCELIEPAQVAGQGEELSRVKAENEEVREANQALQDRLANLEKMLADARAEANKPAGVDVNKLPGSSPSPEEIAQAKADAKPVKPASAKKP